VQAGDRLVVEVGGRTNSASTGISFTQAVFDSQELDDYDYVVDRVSFSTIPSGRSWIEFSANVFGDLTQEMFQFGRGGTILNSSASLPFVDITAIDGLDNAPVRLSSDPREGMHGAIVSSEFEDARTVTLEGDVYASNTQLEAYLDKLKKDFAPSSIPRALYFGADSGLGERLVFGKSQGLRYKKDSFRRLGRVPFQVQIVCEDPRIYSSTPSQVSLVASGTSTITQNFTVGGDRDTPWSLHAVGPLTNPIWQIRTVYGWIGISYTGSLFSTDDLVIDQDSRTAILNRTTNVRSNLSIDRWRPLAPGPTQVNQGVSSSSSGYTLVRYRDAFR